MTTARCSTKKAGCIEKKARRLARPPEERMDFLRVRLPGGGSAL